MSKIPQDFTIPKNKVKLNIIIFPCLFTSLFIRNRYRFVNIYTNYYEMHVSWTELNI